MNAYGLNGISNNTSVGLEIALEKILQEIADSPDCDSLTDAQIVAEIQDGLAHFVQVLEKNSIPYLKACRQQPN